MHFYTPVIHFHIDFLYIVQLTDAAYNLCLSVMQFLFVYVIALGISNQMLLDLLYVYRDQNEGGRKNLLIMERSRYNRLYRLSAAAGSVTFDSGTVAWRSLESGTLSVPSGHRAQAFA